MESIVAVSAAQGVGRIAAIGDVVSSFEPDSADHDPATSVIEILAAA
jgi:hypothetical protein